MNSVDALTGFSAAGASTPPGGMSLPAGDSDTFAELVAQAILGGAEREDTIEDDQAQDTDEALQPSAEDLSLLIAMNGALVGPLMLPSDQPPATLDGAVEPGEGEAAGDGAVAAAAASTPDVVLSTLSASPAARKDAAPPSHQAFDVTPAVSATAGTATNGAAEPTALPAGPVGAASPEAAVSPGGTAAAGHSATAAVPAPAGQASVVSAPASPADVGRQAPAAAPGQPAGLTKSEEAVPAPSASNALADALRAAAIQASPDAADQPARSDAASPAVAPTKLAPGVAPAEAPSSDAGGALGAAMAAAAAAPAPQASSTGHPGGDGATRDETAALAGPGLDAARTEQRAPAFVLPVAAESPVPQAQATGATQPVSPAAFAIHDEQNVQTLVRTVRMQWGAGGGEATVRLDPEHLGPVTLTVRVDKGVVSAHVHTETPEAGQWVQSHQDQLRSSLHEQGLELKDVSVSTNPDGRRERDQTPQQRRRFQRQAQEGSPERVFEVVV